jgi:glyoxylase-like metal-dependent hydrolase (beta-lactamase superfamily II)
MKRDRVSDGVYVFTSGLYAEVTATVVFTDEGAVLVDTLPFPQETRVIRDFISHRRARVLYVVNTHSHADHVNGTYLFPEAVVIAHYRCRQLMERHAEAGLAEAKKQTPQLAEVTIRYPELLFNEGLTLRIGGKTIELAYSPGHSRDVITVHVIEDRLMIASDTVMPVPYLVQGHGSILLRGEIEETLEANIQYLRCVDRMVREFIARGVPRSGIRDISIEQCGLSRIPMGGLVQKLHEANLLTLFDAYRSEMKSGRVNG